MVVLGRTVVVPGGTEDVPGEIPGDPVGDRPEGRDGWGPGSPVEVDKDFPSFVRNPADGLKTADDPSRSNLTVGWVVPTTRFRLRRSPGTTHT